MGETAEIVQRMRMIRRRGVKVVGSKKSLISSGF
jgi:hypothetical protein